MFYATILFAVVYLVRFEVLDGDNQIVEYDKAVAEAKAELNKYRATATDLITAENVTLLTDAKDLGRGKAIFNLNCASCHLSDGGGSIGPNLTDEYWILGGGIKNVFSTISNGGRDGKGMIAWDKTLKTSDIAKVSSYVISLQGTTPAQGKSPQGEKWED
jgi:cytochrome c oxidase cbb3-type subunit 3